MIYLHIRCRRRRRRWLVGRFRRWSGMVSAYLLRGCWCSANPIWGSVRVGFGGLARGVDLGFVTKRDDSTASAE